MKADFPDLLFTELASVLKWSSFTRSSVGAYLRNCGSDMESTCVNARINSSSVNHDQAEMSINSPPSSEEARLVPTSEEDINAKFSLHCRERVRVRVDRPFNF